MAEPPVLAAVESERDAGQVQDLFFLAFLRGGFDNVDGVSGDDIAEILVESWEGRGGGRMVEAE